MGRTHPHNDDSKRNVNRAMYLKPGRSEALVGNVYQYNRVREVEKKEEIGVVDPHPLKFELARSSPFGKASVVRHGRPHHITCHMSHRRFGSPDRIIIRKIPLK